MSRISRPRLPLRGHLANRLPWYAACILIPVASGWTVQQILLLMPVVIVILVLVPDHAHGRA